MQKCCFPSIVRFQSTHPVWGATACRQNIAQVAVISIHAPRVGCDRISGFKWVHPISFQSTHPVWGATLQSTSISMLNILHFNPRTPCGVRHGGGTCCGRRRSISIHAPRVGCDLTLPWLAASTKKFQSTHPVWGATERVIRFCRAGVNFNPRTPCGVRHLGPAVNDHTLSISIHAPRVGCDLLAQV